MPEGKSSEIDRGSLKKNRIRAISRRLDAENERLMAEIEEQLKDYLAAMLYLSHRRLIDGRITLSQYFRDVQMLSCCGERMNQLDP